MIEVVRRAPFAGPLHLRIGTTDVIMRRQDAAGITVVFA
jgi:Fe2+ transport system protein FeoA